MLARGLGIGRCERGAPCRTLGSVTQSLLEIGRRVPTSRGFAKEMAETMNTWRSVGQPVSHFETRIHLILRRSPSARGGVMGHVS